MYTKDKRQWNLAYLNGILAIIFGMVSLLFPSITIIGLAIYFAITILLGGISLMVGSYLNRFGNAAWTLMLFEGLIGTLIGLFIITRPESAAAILMILIGVWSMFIGLVFIWIHTRGHLTKINSHFHLIAGIIAIIVGLLILVNPFGSTRVIVVLIGIYAIIYGIYSIINSSKPKTVTEIEV